MTDTTAENVSKFPFLHKLDLDDLKNLSLGLIELSMGNNAPLLSEIGTLIEKFESK